MSSVARFDTWQAADGTNVARFSGGELEVWDGAAWVAPGPGTATVEYLVIAGGGAGGGGEITQPSITGGAGGAGGYRNSYASETSGGGGSTETPAAVPTGIPIIVKVGAGGTGAGIGATGTRGGESVFYRTNSIGGGPGAGEEFPGRDGGSGSGVGGDLQAGYYNYRSTTPAGGFGFPNQGYNGSGGRASGARSGGAGGGAGGNASGSTGGVGLASSITGSSVTRAAGGNITTDSSPVAGGTNTGTGGGASGNSGGANGGSGIVVIRYPDTFTVTVGAGLTSSTTTSGSDKITTFTAGEDTVTFE